MAPPKLRDVMAQATRAGKKSFTYGDGTFEVVQTKKTQGSKIKTRARKVRK